MTNKSRETGKIKTPKSIKQIKTAQESILEKRVEHETRGTTTKWQTKRVKLMRVIKNVLHS